VNFGTPVFAYCVHYQFYQAKVQFLTSVVYRQGEEFKF
jgi:hypothetical protein